LHLYLCLGFSEDNGEIGVPRPGGTTLFPTLKLKTPPNGVQIFPHFFQAHVFFCFFSLRQRKERIALRKNGKLFFLLKKEENKKISVDK